MEGVLRRTIAGLEQDQPVRRALEPEDAAKIDSYVKRIEDLFSLNQPFHIVSHPHFATHFPNLTNVSERECILVSRYNKT